MDEKQIKKEEGTRQSPIIPETETNASSQYVPLNESTKKQESKREEPNTFSDIAPDEKKRFSKRIKAGAAVLLLAGCVALGIGIANSTSKSPDTSGTAQQAAKDHFSTNLEPGTVLFSTDDEAGQSGFDEDYTVETTNRSERSTKLYVWDYAAEDGDYVQIYVNGESLGDPFMIKNKPVSFEVPTESEVTIVGTRDGGGGITYAAYYESNHTTYFNGMDVGGDNIYTLVIGSE